MDAFHAAYARGAIVDPPTDYIELILMPAILHIDPLALASYSPALKSKMWLLLRKYLAAGWAGAPETIQRGK